MSPRAESEVFFFGLKVNWNPSISGLKNHILIGANMFFSLLFFDVSSFNYTLSCLAGGLDGKKSSKIDTFPLGPFRKSFIILSAELTSFFSTAR